MGRGTCLWVSSQVVRGSPGSVKPCTEIVCAQHFFFSGGKCNHLFLQSVSDLKKKIRNRGVDRLAIRKQTLHPRQPWAWGDARGSCAPQMTAGGGGGPRSHADPAATPGLPGPPRPPTACRHGGGDAGQRVLCRRGPPVGADGAWGGVPLGTAPVWHRRRFLCFRTMNAKPSRTAVSLLFVVVFALCVCVCV